MFGVLAEACSCGSQVLTWSKPWVRQLKGGLSRIVATPHFSIRAGVRVGRHRVTDSATPAKRDTLSLPGAREGCIISADTPRDMR